MFDLLLGPARRVRHVLDAWLLLAACLVAGMLPLLGLPVVLALAGLGCLAALRLAGYGQVLHCLLLLFLFAVVAILLVVGNVAWLYEISPSMGRKAEEYAMARRAGDRRADAAPASPVPAAPAPVPPGHSILYGPQVPAPPPPSSMSSPHGAAAPASIPVPVAPSRQVPKWEPMAEAERTGRRWMEARGASDIGGAAGLCLDAVSVSGQSLDRGQLAERMATADPTYGRDKEEILERPYVVQLPSTGGYWRTTFRVSFLSKMPGSPYGPRGQRSRTVILADVGDGFRVAEDRYENLPHLADPELTVGGFPGGRIRDLLSHCVVCDLAGDLEASAACYAEQAEYFGKKMDRAAILADKQAYARRWPVRRESFYSPLRLEELPDGRILAQFAGPFRTESAERGEWSEGTVQHRFVLQPKRNDVWIVEQSGKVVDPSKGKIGN